ncbi:hypothetical protein [Leptolyngbya sp. 7M]|uniref:hypothetical protein n=1 Tax=Leptolyngbya sp. 7M TaxID=2812896 RepID=UPI001B8C7054|nr:hypothetical protein [Leptolyngbya sp. 7M]QYO68023.1 hypothetical protein JVX88_15350 [Leptolyngbya sp. 7M]
MNEKYIQILGMAVSAIYFAFIVFLYAAEPRSLEELTVKARETLDTAVTKGTIITGTYSIDSQLFQQGVNDFRQDNFIAARDAFMRADPERRDADVQFYIAYSFYRQGWGRFSNDDVLFRNSIETLDRVIILDPNFRSKDTDLKLRTPAELRAELDEGLRITADDFNPMRLLRERK